MVVVAAAAALALVVIVPHFIHFILLCTLYLSKYLLTFLTCNLCVQFMTSLYPNASFISSHASYKNCILYFHVSGSVKLGRECCFNFDAPLNLGNFDGMEGHVLHVSPTVLQELSYSFKH